MAVSERFPAVLQPLFGALIGLCGAALIVWLPGGPGAIAALVLWTAVTFARGELGFSRWFPKLPLFGTLLAACTILVRWYALISLQNGARLLPAVAVATTLGPAAAIALGWVSRPVDDAAFRRLSRLNTQWAVVAIAEGIAAAALCGIRVGLVLVLVCWLVLRLVLWVGRWRIGGVRGSDLEATRVVVETISLVVLSSLRELL